MQHPITSLLLRLALPSALLVVAPPLAQAGGYEETEHRLKTAGIEPALRSRIHDAIDRAVVWLRKRQRRDGSIASSPGHTALVGLALRHAATPAGVAGGRRALAWLDERSATGDLRDRWRTYTLGLTAMLRQADGHPAADLGRGAAALVQGPAHARGFWGYVPEREGGLANLSTSQFGALGLWAASRADVPVPPAAWRRHLDALLNAQLADGSWAYWAPGAPWGSAPGARLGDVHGASYPTGTFMGLANLVLSASALEGRLARHPENLARVHVALGRGRAALRRHFAWVCAAPSLDAAWALPFYRLYAIEKVAIFLDVEEIAGLPWYRMAATHLVETQSPEGHWGAPLSEGAVIFAGSLDQTVQTAFGLLVLLRASRAYHPTTPRSPDGPPVVTPGPVLVPPPVEPAAAATAEVSALCDRLEALVLVHRICDLDGALDDLKALGPLCRSGSEAGGAGDALRRAHDLLLHLARRFAEPGADGGLAWQAVALAALEALHGPDDHTALRLMRLVETLVPSDVFPEVFRPAWYAAALEALVRLEARGLGAWLVERGLDPAREQWARTSASLVTLGGLPLTAAERRAALTAIFARLEPALDDLGYEIPARHLRFDVLVACKAIAGPRADDFPTLEIALSGNVSPVRRALRRWWRGHRAATDPLWQDE